MTYNFFLFMAFTELVGNGTCIFVKIGFECQQS